MSSFDEQSFDDIVYGTPLTKRRSGLGGSRIFRFVGKSFKNRSNRMFDRKPVQVVPSSCSQESGFLSTESVKDLKTENDPNISNIDVSADSMMSLSCQSDTMSGRGLSRSLCKSSKSLSKLPAWTSQTLQGLDHSLSLPPDGMLSDNSNYESNLVSGRCNPWYRYKI